MNEAIIVSGFSKRYEGFELRVGELCVPCGCVTGLIGGNGAGKTTLIKAILGMLPGYEGNVSTLGVDFSKSSEREIAQLKQDIGVVLDTCAFPGDLVIHQCAHAMRKLYPSWNDEAFMQLAGMLDLPLERKVKELSRGMGMKLTLACALSHAPKLLVLDEATAGLDPMARDEVIDLVRDFMLQDEERAVLMASHITSDLDKVADAIVCIDEGRIIFDVERDVIERAGVVTCSKDGLETLAAEEEPGTLRVVREPYSTRALIPDRFAFAAKHPHAAIEPANIEAYMQFMMKGERL